ncbi:MAG: hypothetical protein M0C28_43465 [Candidatus Moduliflexus flocculans]|nr:hypothetical protein [Candidatus Moduliflexus flocculans]
MVLDTSDDAVVVQVFEGTTGPDHCRARTVRFRGAPLTPAGHREACWAGSSTASGSPIDGGPAPSPADGAGRQRPAHQPRPRASTRGTSSRPGISAIDGMNTLIRGQKLPIFSGNGLPHNELAAQIARQAKIRGRRRRASRWSSRPWASSTTWPGSSSQSFEETGVLENVALFLSLADDPSIERLITPADAP